MNTPLYRTPLYRHREKFIKYLEHKGFEVDITTAPLEMIPYDKVYINFEENSLLIENDVMNFEQRSFELHHVRNDGSYISIVMLHNKHMKSIINVPEEHINKSKSKGKIIGKLYMSNEEAIENLRRKPV
jgi:hypothetical protein